MNEQQKENLQRAIAYVRTIPKRDFRFSCVLNTRRDVDGNICGTVGCFIGHMPGALPELISWQPEVRNVTPEYFILEGRTICKDRYAEVAARLFGMNENDASDLFTPQRQNYLGLPTLGNDATPNQVADVVQLWLTRKLGIIEWHRPIVKDLPTPPETPGEGYRFLTKSEVFAGANTADCEFWYDVTDKWMVASSRMNYADTQRTCYRTKRPLPSL